MRPDRHAEPARARDRGQERAGEGAPGEQREVVALAPGTHPADDGVKVSGWSHPAIKAMSRVYAREAALRVAEEGLRWIFGAEEDTNVNELETALNLSAIHAAQRGLVADMDLIVQALQESSFE